jgi:2-amino-4-hydroxy-6-hydroxymethyldihydropteridine diphosphokinase
LQDKIFLGLGSNIGDRLSFLRKAVTGINDRKDIIVNKMSSVYESDAWGVEEQNSFLNMVMEISSSLSAAELLTFLKYLEINTGRKQRARWTEREIDIDIIFYGNKIINLENIIIPHPEMQNRKFVLMPLCEIDKDFIHPVSGISCETLLQCTRDKLSCTATDLKIL